MSIIIYMSIVVHYTLKLSLNGLNQFTLGKILKTFILVLIQLFAKFIFNHFTNSIQPYYERYIFISY